MKALLRSIGLAALAVTASAAGRADTGALRVYLSMPQGMKALPEGLPVRLARPDARFLAGDKVQRVDGAYAAPGLAGRLTIAPFPVPGDTSRNAAARMQRLNVPKPGRTTIAPIPPPPGLQSTELGTLGDPGSSDTLSGAAPDFRADLNGFRILTGAPPVYPEAARDQGIQGTVVVRAHVRADGTVGETQVLHSVPGLDEAAVAAVKTWRFISVATRGRPRDAWVLLPVRFALH